MHFYVLHLLAWVHVCTENQIQFYDLALFVEDDES